MRVQLVVSAVALAASAIRSPAQPSAATAVRAAQHARFTALMHRDSIALDTLLGAALRYTHSNGDHETKAQYLLTVMSGRIRYESIEPDSVDVQVLGNVATTIGRSRMQVVNTGTPATFSIRFSETYVRRGTRWELVLYQAARLAEK